MSRRLLWLSPSLPSEHEDQRPQHCPALPQLPALLCTDKSFTPINYLCDFWFLLNNNICDCVLRLHVIDLSSIIWLNFNILFICCCLYSMYYNEIKRAQGAWEDEWELSIKMWENVARSNVDYLLLWQWVWILQAAGRLLFLNKAFFFSHWSDEDAHSWN